MNKLSIGAGLCKEIIKRDNKNAVIILNSVLEDCILDIIDVIEKYVTKSKKNKYYQYSSDNKIIKIWFDPKEFENEGYKKQGVYDCCTGKLRTYKGYKWSRYPL